MPVEPRSTLNVHNKIGRPMHSQEVKDVLHLQKVIVSATDTADLISALIEWRGGTTQAPEPVAAEPKPAPAKAAPAKKVSPPVKSKPAKTVAPVDDDDEFEPTPDPSDDDAF